MMITITMIIVKIMRMLFMPALMKMMIMIFRKTIMMVMKRFRDTDSSSVS